MITRALFKEVINAMMEQQEIDCEIDGALGKVCGSFVCFNTENKLWRATSVLLAYAAHDEENDYIGWWLYDTECGKRNYTLYYSDHATRDIKTVDDLYNLLEEEYNGRNKQVS